MSYQLNAEPIRFQCRHIFTDGRRCQNPTLRSPQSDENSGGHENFCYFHHTTRRPIENPKARRSRQSRFTLPLLEDRSAIQLAIGEVLQKIASNDIDPRRAGLLLYGLQIASLNLKKDRRNDEPDEAETVDEITHDPTLGHLAPPAELGSNEPKGSAQRILEELPWDDEEDDKKSILPALHAVAAQPLPEPELTTLISRICAKNRGRSPFRSAEGRREAGSTRAPQTAAPPQSRSRAKRTATSQPRSRTSAHTIRIAITLREIRHALSF